MADTFDIDGARKAGYSDAEIADHLAQQRGFDAAGARKAGYSDAEILQHLTPAAASPGYFEQTSLFHPKEVAASLIPQATGFPGATGHPIDALQGWLQQNGELGQKALDAFKAGNIAEGFRHTVGYLANMVPGVGAKLDTAGNQLQAGDTGGGAATTASLATDLLAGAKTPAILDAATEPGALTKAANLPSTAVHKVADFAQSPGAGRILEGAAEVPTGAALMIHGNPVWGAGMTARGAVQLMRGFSERWKAAAAAGDQAAADAIAAEAQRAANARVGQPNSPAWANVPTPTETTPPAFNGTPATALPSGRTVGGIQNQTAAPPAPSTVSDPAAFAKLPPQIQDAIRAAAARRAPASAGPAAPRSPEYYGVQPAVHTSPVPEVRATPSTPPPTGPQSVEQPVTEQHPVYALPRTPLNSSAIKSAAYHAPTQTQLIEMQNGRTLVHPGLPPELHQGLLDAAADPAQSAGQFYNQNIRPRYETATSVLRPKGATPSERPVLPLEQQLADSNDYAGLRQAVHDYKLGTPGMTHEAAVKQATLINNFLRSQRGLAPYSQAVVNKVLQEGAHE